MHSAWCPCAAGCPGRATRSALDCLPRRPGTTRAAAPPKRAVHGRVRLADLRGHQPRAPAAASADRADAVLLGLRQHPRAGVRTARAIAQAGQRAALLLTRLAPAPTNGWRSPATRRRRRPPPSASSRSRSCKPARGGRQVRAWLYGAASSGPSFGRESSRTHSLGCQGCFYEVKGTLARRLKRSREMWRLSARRASRLVFPSRMRRSR